MGDALISAASLVYSGVLTSEYRQQLANECLRLCNENMIPMSPNYSLIAAMTEKNEVIIWAVNKIVREVVCFILFLISYTKHITRFFRWLIAFPFENST